MGLCTNKPEAPARAILAHLGLERYFAAVVGGDTLGVTKPDPRPLAHLLAALPPGPRLYVGDSEVDAETARAAGVQFALFTEGYRKVPVADLPHDVSFSNFKDLPAIVVRSMG
jgi:phosphoglycolate phosphatase